MWQLLSMTLGINYRQCQFNGTQFATGISITGRIIGALENMIHETILKSKIYVPLSLYICAFRTCFLKAVLSRNFIWTKFLNLKDQLLLMKGFITRHENYELFRCMLFITDNKHFFSRTLRCCSCRGAHPAVRRGK